MAGMGYKEGDSSGEARRQDLGEMAEVPSGGRRHLCQTDFIVLHNPGPRDCLFTFQEAVGKGQPGF